MAKIKGVQVSATIPVELNNALEDHRWTVRKTKAEVIKTAIEEYADRHVLIPIPHGEPTGEPAHENVV